MYICLINAVRSTKSFQNWNCKGSRIMNEVSGMGWGVGMVRVIQLNKHLVSADPGL